LTFFITPFHYTDCFSVRQIGYGGKELLMEQRRQLAARIGEMQAVLDRLDKKIEGYESHLLKAERSLKR
jgi:hypothetical protein